MSSAPGPPRPCLDCGDPTTAGTRCEPCRTEYERGRSTRNNARRASTKALGYDAAWRKLSALARRMTPWCADAHLGDCEGRLTADHLPGAWEKLERGQRLTLLDVEVVCLRHNGQRGGRRTGTPRRDPGG